jgi:dynein heavy chain
MWLQSLFFFSVIWSIGASIDPPSRKKFSVFFRNLASATSQLKVLHPFPAQGEVYDYVFDKSKSKWTHWMSITPGFNLPPGHELQFHEVFVPVMETVRSQYLLELLVTHNKHVLFAGPTATGKTSGVHQVLTKLDPQAFATTFLNFSFQISANQAQDIIDFKLLRRGHEQYGPLPGKRFVIFVDDLNSPTTDSYGAQPAIELLRQFMDYGGWYDRKTNQMKHIIDTQFVAVMQCKFWNYCTC